MAAGAACVCAAAVLWVFGGPAAAFGPAGAAPQPAAPQPAAPIPVIIDTDIGDDIDDAFALAVALTDPRLEVVGITTSWGDTRTRTLLVRRLLAAIGRTDVIVAQGPATPDAARFSQKQWALGATNITPAPDAVEFIRSEVRKRPGAITLLALAPLSTVQALEPHDAATLRGLKQVVIMAGSIYAGYNTGGAIPNPVPSAEWNVVSAPKALADLLELGIPIRLFPLDSTQLKFDEVRRDRLFAFGSSTSDALTLLYHQWRFFNDWSQITPTLFDVVPVAWLLQPGLCALSPMRIAVDAKGYTRPAEGAPNVSVCLSEDEVGTQRLIQEHLTPQPPAKPR